MERPYFLACIEGTITKVLKQLKASQTKPTDDEKAEIGETFNSDDR